MGLISDSVLKHVPVRATLESLSQVFSEYSEPNFRVRLWGGTIWGASDNPRFTLVVKHPNALRQMFVSPSELTLGECYISDELDIEGDIAAAVEMGGYLLSQERHSLPASLRLASIVAKLSTRHAEPGSEEPDPDSNPLHSLDRDRRSISYH